MTDAEIVNPIFALMRDNQRNRPRSSRYIDARPAMAQNCKVQAQMRFVFWETTADFSVSEEARGISR